MRAVAVGAAVIVAIAGFVLGMMGCSSTSSPSDILPWYEGASWVSGANFTTGSTIGASLVWDGDDLLFTHSGWEGRGNGEFWQYAISTDSWTELGDPVISPYWSTSIAWTGGDHMYAVKGNGTASFFRYTISSDEWTGMADFPEHGVRRMGHAIVWPGSGDHVYVAKGNNEDVFARYDTSGDSWEYLASIPQTMGNGSQISWGGGTRIFAAADHKDFFEYDITTDAWEARTALPESLHLGAWLCYDGDGSLFLAQGDTTASLFRYDIQDASWETMSDIPVEMKSGASMVCDGEALYVLPGGGSTDFWILKR